MGESKTERNASCGYLNTTVVKPRGQLKDFSNEGLFVLLTALKLLNRLKQTAVLHEDDDEKNDDGGGRNKKRRRDGQKEEQRIEEL